MNHSSAKPEILLVENNDHDAKLISVIYLKNKISHSLIRVRNGADAINYLSHKKEAKQRNNSGPAIILLDDNLPGMTSQELLKTIRRDFSTEPIPVFVLTCSDMDKGFSETQFTEATDFIHKHILFDKLEEALLETEIYL